MSRHDLDRRTFVRGAGAAAGIALGTGPAAAIDDAIDQDGGVQEVIVVFHDDADPTVLDRFDLQDGYHAFDVLPFAYTRATGEQIRRIAALDGVRYVEKNKELELHNDDGRELTRADVVHEDLGVTGEGVHAVVIDTGLTTHPDLMNNLTHNYHFVDPLTTDEEQMWVDVGNADIDDVGHGSHVAGSVAGDGQMSDGQYRGTAPDASITGYKTNVAGALYIIYLVAAIEDVLRKQRDGVFDVQVVNNSFGLSNDGDFNPGQAIHLAYWEAFKEGIVPVFSAGNSGSDHGTLNYLGKQPYSLCVAATHTGDTAPPKQVTGFSSRGRPPVEDEGMEYASDYDYSQYERNEGPVYDRKAALENVRDFHRSGQSGAEEVTADYLEEFTVTVNTTINDPTAWTAALGLSTTIVDGGTVHVEWDSPPGAGYLDGVFDVGELNRQSVYVSLYRGDSDAVENDEAVLVAQDGNVIRDGQLELDVPIDESTTYTFEFEGFNNVQTEVTANLTALQSVPRPDGPFGMYRCDVGAPGNLITSTNKPTEVLGAIYTATDGEDTSPWYARLSGTSMSCPLTAGVVALVFEAYKAEAGHFPKPIDVINIMEAAAEGGTQDELEGHTPANMGAGFVDALAAVELARELGAEVAERGPPDHAGPPGESEDPPGQSGDTPAEGQGPPWRNDDPTVPEHPELWAEIDLCTAGKPESAAEEDGDAGDFEVKEEGCIHVVESTSISTLSDGRPAQVGGSVVLPSSPTPSFRVADGAYSKTPLSGQRLVATMTWNPTDQGPTNANLFVERQGEDGWETIGYEQSESATGGAVNGENRVRIVAVDGDRYQGTNGDATTPDADNEIVVDGNNTYRFRVQGENGVQNFEIDVEVQSFAPGCTDSAD